MAEEAIVYTPTPIGGDGDDEDTRARTFVVKLAPHRFHRFTEALGEGMAAARLRAPLLPHKQAREWGVAGGAAREARLRARSCVTRPSPSIQRPRSSAGWTMWPTWSPLRNGN